MQIEVYDELIEKFRLMARGIRAAKSPGYNGERIDCLGQFKEIAAAAGISPMQAWAILFLKHVTAIMSFAKNPAIPQAETLDGRFADAYNYIELGYGLMRDLGGYNPDVPKPVTGCPPPVQVRENDGSQ